jgi:alanine racemase
MIENSHIEINLAALKNNFTFINDKLGNTCELVSVVKGNAYGHGIENFVPAANYCGVKSFAVFSAFEAHKLHQLALQIDRILIMGYIDHDQIEWAIINGIEFYVFDTKRLIHTINTSKKLNKKAKIHIEVETGLNRTGFDTESIELVYRLLSDGAEHIEIKGLCSHLGGAENITNFDRIKNQIKRFNDYSVNFQKKQIHIEKKHLACSAAIINYPKTILDLARIGIMQYGLWPSEEVRMAYFARNKIMIDPLEPVLSWKSRVMSTKMVKKGAYIGYGLSLQAEEDMLIATVPVGYADGFARSLSNQGKVLINGLRLDVIGIVNMNLFIVDAKNTQALSIGDEVVMIGKQGDRTISIASFSDFSNQLNYELLTRLPNDIPRIMTT